MPQFNTTIEDFSSIISYSPDWRAGSSNGDASADQYSEGSFQVTQSNGATATFSFNGTSFTIFGAKRANHGSFQVSVDGSAFPSANGKAPDPGQFQIPLFSSPVLAQGLHTVTLTNLGTDFVDIDFITWQSSIGDDNESLIVNTIQDTDPSFVYSPPTQWGTSPPNVATYSGSTGHGTATPGAFMDYTFEGDAVWLYGPVGPQGSSFSVSLDGGGPSQYTANRNSFRSQALLYVATNLGPGKHTVKVSYQPSAPGQIFAIDFANVYTTPSLQSLSGHSAVSSQSNSLPSAAVAGIVISLVFVLILLAGFLFFLRRRKARRERDSLGNPIVQPSFNNRDIVHPSFNNRDIVAAPIAARNAYPSAPAPSTRYSSSAASSYYQGPSNLAIDTQSQRYAPSAPSESEFSPETHFGGSQAGSFSGTQRNNVTVFTKGQPVPLPPTASQSLAHIPPEQLRANRRVVSGRLQDFGPAPPDYVQATEPYAMV